MTRVGCGFALAVTMAACSSSSEGGAGGSTGTSSSSSAAVKGAGDKVCKQFTAKDLASIYGTPPTSFPDDRAGASPLPLGDCRWSHNANGYPSVGIGLVAVKDLIRSIGASTDLTGYESAEQYWEVNLPKLADSHPTREAAFGPYGYSLTKGDAATIQWIVNDEIMVTVTSNRAGWVGGAAPSAADLVAKNRLLAEVVRVRLAESGYKI